MPLLVLFGSFIAEGRWKAPIDLGEDVFSVEMIDGAEGKVRFDGDAIEIHKFSNHGTIVVTPKVGFRQPVGAKLRSFADVAVTNTEGEYALGYLRLFGASRNFAAFRELDGGAFMGGGPKMAWLVNTPPGKSDRRFSHFIVRDEKDSNLTPAIIVTGAASRSTWKNWSVEDYDEAKAQWKIVQSKHPMPNHLTERIGKTALSAKLARDTEHTARVVKRNGEARLLVDGEAVPPVIYLASNTWGDRNDSFNGNRMAKVGVRLQAIRIWYGSGVQKKLARWTKDGFDLSGAVEDVRRRMEMSPDALYILQLRVSPYPEFATEHPDERWLDAAGRPVFGNDSALCSESKGWPWISMSSLRWRDEVKCYTAKLIKALKDEGLSKRIIGIHFCGFMDAQFAPAVPDYGKPALRAWGKPIPEIGDMSFFSPIKDQDSIEFAKFQHLQPLRVQEELAQFAKDCFGKEIIALHWTLGVFGGEFCATYHLSDFLKSDSLDAAISQTSYPRRLPGMALGNPLPTASFHRHGKLYLNELDLRTYGHLESYYSEIASIGVGCARDYGEWRAAHLKMAGWCMANHVGWWYYDLAGGFFDPPEIVADIADTMDCACKVFGAELPQWRPSAAFVVDEKGMLLRNYFAELRDKGTSSLVREQIHLMAGSGVPFDTWLMEDVLADHSALAQRKVAVFAGTFALDDARRRLIDELLANGTTVVFLSATGYADGSIGGYGFSPILRKAGSSHEIVAQQGECQTEFLSFHDAQYRRWVLGVNHGELQQFYRPWSIGFKDAARVRVFARYVDDKMPAIVQRDVGGGRIVAIGDCAGLTPAFFSRLVREAGGYVPARRGLQVDMNGGFASLHCLESGHYDFKTPDGRTIPLDLRAGESRWLNLKTRRDADRNGYVLSAASGRPVETQAPRDILCNAPDYVCFVPRNNRKFPGNSADPAKRGDSYNDHFQVISDPVRNWLYAFWTQATHESAADQHIAFSKSVDGGFSWSEPLVLAGSETCANPTARASWQQPMLSKRGRLYCLWNQSINGSRPHYGLPFGRFSDDGGTTWSEPEALSRFVRMDADGPDATKLPCWCNWQRPLRLATADRFFVGCTRFGRATYDKGQCGKIEFWRFENIDEHPAVRDICISQFAINRAALGAEHVVPITGFKFFAPRPDAAGKIAYPSLEEASIVKLPDGRLFALMRSTLGCPVWSQSRDSGETWERPRVLLDVKGRPILHSCSPCPMYDWKGCEAGSGTYFALVHNKFDFDAPSAYQKRGALYLIAGRFDSAAEQPIVFSEPRLFAPRAANNSCYSSYTVVDGEGVLWMPDQKYYLIGRKIGSEWFVNKGETKGE